MWFNGKIGDFKSFVPSSNLGTLVLINKINKKYINYLVFRFFSLMVKLILDKNVFNVRSIEESYILYACGIKFMYISSYYKKIG